MDRLRDVMDGWTNSLEGRHVIGSITGEWREIFTAHFIYFIKNTINSMDRKRVAFMDLG